MAWHEKHQLACAIENGEMAYVAINGGMALINPQYQNNQSMKWRNGGVIGVIKITWRRNAASARRVINENKAKIKINGGGMAWQKRWAAYRRHGESGAA
jgi:hypothetical protein